MIDSLSSKHYGIAEWHFHKFVDKRDAMNLRALKSKTCCEILKYSQVYELYQSIVRQERCQTHRDLNERGKIN